MRVVVILLSAGIWALWASMSEGGLHQLKQINPKFPHPDKSVPYLQSKLSYAEGNGVWDSFHVNQCSLYMPNWEKAEKCVDARVACEADAPRDTGIKTDRADIFSTEFETCNKKSQPLRGPGWWLHASRSVFRFGVLYVLANISGGWNLSGNAASDWEKNNKWWANPVTDWAQNGE